MADTVNKKVTIRISAYDETGKAISKIADNLLGLQKALTSVDTGLAKVASLTKSIGDSFKGVRLDQLGVERFANDIKFLEGIDGKKIANVASGIKKLNGIVIDPSISNLSILKELSGITFPSFQKVLTLIAKLREGVPAADLKGLAEGLTALSKVKIPNSIKNLGITLKELQGITGFADLSKVATSFAQFSTITKLPAIGPFVKNLKELSTIQGFPDLTAVVASLDKAKSIGKLPNLNTFIASLKKLETGGLKIDTAKLDAIAKAFAGFAGITNIPSITPFVNSLKKLQGIQIPSMGQLVAQIQKLGDAFSKISAATPFITAMNQIGTASQNVTAQLNAANQAGHAHASMWDKLGQKVKNYIGYRLIADSIIALKEAFTGGIQAVIDYDQGLKNLQAITGATSEEVTKMAHTIERVASTTKFSATEVADGMVILGQAGLSAVDSVKTIRAVADLATGTLSSMQTSVDIVTSALAVFNIKAEDSGRVADIFANAINKSKLTIEKMVTALNYVGPVASDLGLTLEETSSALGVLSNAGLRASTIGTGFRRILSELADPSTKMKDAIESVGLTLDDLDPRVNEFGKVIANLGVVLSDTSVAFDLFGKYGASAALTLTDSVSGGYQEMMDQIAKYGTTQDMARVQMEGLGVSLKNMKDKFALVGVAVGKAGGISGMKAFTDAGKNLADGLVALIENGISPVIVGFDKLTSIMRPLPNYIEGVIYAVVGLTMAFGSLGKAFAFLKITAVINGLRELAYFAGVAFGSMTKLGAVAATLQYAIYSLGGPITVAVVGLTALAGAIGYVISESDREIRNLEKATVRYNEASESVKGYLAELDRLSKVPITDRERIELMDKMSGAFPELAAEIRATMGDITKLTAVMNEHNESLKKIQLNKQISGLDAFGTKALQAAKKLDYLKVAQRNVGDSKTAQVQPPGYGFMNADALADEIAKQENELDKWLANIVSIAMDAQKAGKQIPWNTIFPNLEEGSKKMDEMKNLVLTKRDEIVAGLAKESKDSSISLYGNAGEWKKELDDAGTIYSQYAANQSKVVEKFDADIRELVKGIDASVIEATAKATEAFADEVAENEKLHDEGKRSNVEYYAHKKDIEKRSRAYTLQNLTNEASDLSAFNLKKAEQIQKWYDNERVEKLKSVTDSREKENIEYRLWIEKQQKIAAAKLGFGADDPKELLENIKSNNTKAVDAETAKFAALERERIKDKESVREVEAEKLEITLQRLSAEYLAAMQARKIIDTGTDKDAQAKAAEAEAEALKKLEEGKTAVIKHHAKTRTELRKEEYDELKEVSETGYTKIMDAIADAESQGTIPHQKALEKKAAVTLDYYARQYQAAVAYAERVRKEEGEDNDEYRDAYKEKLDTEQKYFEERTKLLDEYVDNKKKAEDDLTELGTKDLREAQDYEKKFVNLGKKSSDELVKLERTYAEKVKEINEKLKTKVIDLDRDRTEKYEKFAKKRKEAEEGSASSILLWQEKIADSIREVEGRGKSDKPKERDNEKAAADKLRRGEELLAKARAENNKEAYEAGKELIDQSHELYKGLENEKKALKGLSKVGRAGQDIVDTEEQLKKNEIDEDKADVDSKYDYEKEKAEAAAKDELEDAADVRKNRIKEIQEIYTEDAAQEKLRHERVMEDFEIEKNKLIEILNTANAIIAQTTGNVKLGNQIATGKEAQKTTGEQPQIDWSEHMTIDPETGQRIFKAVAGQVKDAAEASKDKVEVPVAPVETPEATAVGTVTAMVDNLRVNLTDPFQIMFAVSGTELLQQAIDLIAQIKDKTVTITTKYVPEGSSASSSTTTAPIATAFNGGLIGFFRNGGNVFKKLASPFISAGRGFLDDVPAMLSRNEFVHRARAVREYGVGFMRSVNDLRFPKELARGFAGGGLAGVDGIGALAGLTGNFTIPESLANGLRSTIDNSSISTYNVTIGDKALRPRGRVANLTNNLLKEVRKQY